MCPDARQYEAALEGLLQDGVDRGALLGRESPERHAQQVGDAKPSSGLGAMAANRKRSAASTSSP